MTEVNSLSDRAKYEDIVKKLGNVDDIPPKGGHLVKSRRTRAKTRKTIAKKTRSTQKHPAKPSYSSVLPKKSQIWQLPEPLARPDSVPTYPARTEIHTRAKTYEDKLSSEKSYSEMIALIRNNSQDIDFGLSLRILPKNIGVEQARFEIPADSAPCFDHARPLFSNDIDMFFRSLSQNPDSKSVPLV